MEETGDSKEEQWARRQQQLVCPLLSLRPQTLDDSVRRLVKAADPNACLGGRCAWWDEEAGTCAVLTLARIVRAQSAK